MNASLKWFIYPTWDNPEYIQPFLLYNTVVFCIMLFVVVCYVQIIQFGLCAFTLCALHNLCQPLPPDECGQQLFAKGKKKFLFKFYFFFAGTLYSFYFVVIWVGNKEWVENQQNLYSNDSNIAYCMFKVMFM